MNARKSSWPRRLASENALPLQRKKPQLLLHLLLQDINCRIRRIDIRLGGRGRGHVDCRRGRWYCRKVLRLWSKVWKFIFFEGGFQGFLPLGFAAAQPYPQKFRLSECKCMRQPRTRSKVKISTTFNDKYRQITPTCLPFKASSALGMCTDLRWVYAPAAADIR